MSDLPAPSDPLLTTFGGTFEDCFSTPDFSYDEAVVQKFHRGLVENNDCIVPFFNGDGYKERNNVSKAYCTKGRYYNTTYCELILILFPLTPPVNAKLAEALADIHKVPCNHTKLRLGPLLGWGEMKLFFQKNSDFFRRVRIFLSYRYEHFRLII